MSQVNVSALNESIKAAISGATNTIRDAAVNHYAQKEIERRSNMIVEAIAAGNRLQGEHKKFKPDVNGTFDAAGTVLTPASYSQAQLEKVKKSTESITNLDNAVTECFNSGTEEAYAKLEKILAKLKGGNNNGGNKNEAGVQFE